MACKKAQSEETPTSAEDSGGRNAATSLEVLNVLAADRARQKEEDTNRSWLKMKQRDRIGAAWSDIYVSTPPREPTDYPKWVRNIMAFAAILKTTSDVVAFETYEPDNEAERKALSVIQAALSGGELALTGRIFELDAEGDHRDWKNVFREDALFQRILYPGSNFLAEHPLDCDAINANETSGTGRSPSGYISEDVLKTPVSSLTAPCPKCGGTRLPEDHDRWCESCRTADGKLAELATTWRLYDSYIQNGHETDAKNCLERLRGKIWSGRDEKFSWRNIRRVAQTTLDTEADGLQLVERIRDWLVETCKVQDELHMSLWELLQRLRKAAATPEVGEGALSDKQGNPSESTIGKLAGENSPGISPEQFVGNDSRPATDNHMASEYCGIAKDSSGETSDPIQWLTSWREITTVLNRSHDEYRNIKRINEFYNGPIPSPRRGAQPRVDRKALIEWWNSMEVTQWEQEGRGQSRRLSVETRQEFGRTGEIIHEIGGEVKKRRRQS